MSPEDEVQALGESISLFLDVMDAPTKTAIPALTQVLAAIIGTTYTEPGLAEFIRRTAVTTMAVDLYTVTGGQAGWSAADAVIDIKRAFEQVEDKIPDEMKPMVHGAVVQMIDKYQRLAGK